MADYYDTLGVARDASEKDIRSAFRKLARKHHPDVNKNDPASEEKFKEINEAYTVLTDKESRRKYDRYGNDWKHADQYEQAGRGGGFSYSNRGGVRDVTGGGRSSIFDQFFGGMGGQDFRPPPAEYPVSVTLEEAFSGAARRLQLQDGRRLEVKIPPGVDNGSRVHISADRSHGGDFYLIVSVKDHARFSRKGKDLFVEVEVALDDAVLGGELTVPTLTGRLALTIPQGTQNGRRFRLAGQGMPAMSRSASTRGDVDHRGDLFATVKVKLPAEFTEEELELFQKLRAKRTVAPTPPNPAVSGEINGDTGIDEPEADDKE
ncbi:MAG: DnaJ domain-containing protein [Chloroflexi bacterium]|nr:DnaJ domain-containing protein [Chloroflexota bacterium]